MYWPRFVFQTAIAVSWIFLPEDITRFDLYNGVMFYHVATVLMVLILLPLIVQALKLYCTKYDLGTERLLVYSGILSRRREVIELYRVKDFKVVSPLHLRVFGFSNIFLYTSDRTAPELMLCAVQDGYGTEDTIRQRVEEMRKAKGVREFD